MTRVDVPPGPSSRLWTTFQIMREPFAWYRAMGQRYGQTFSAHALNGDLVVTGDPELVHTIFALDEESVAPFGVEAVGPLLGFSSVILVQGRQHRRARRLLMPPFHGERMRAYGQRMHQIAAARVDAWPVDSVLTAHHQMLEISLQVIIETIFGVDDAAEMRAMTTVIEALIDGFQPALLFAKALQRDFGGLGPWRRTRLTRDAFRAQLLDVVKRRRADGAGRTDILSLLLAARDEAGEPMADEEVIDHLVTLLLAGHETTAISLSWAIHWLGVHLPAQQRLRDELTALGPDATPEQIADAPFLDAVVKETLRLYPIVPDVLRTLLVPVQFGRWTVPAGWSLVAVAAMTHYRDDLYPNPDAFVPERWLDRPARPNEYYPFGGGIRRCIGAAFATYEMKQVLAALVVRRTWVSAESQPVKPVRRNVTMAPEGGVRFTTRRA